jgi:hypothetical protein
LEGDSVTSNSRACLQKVLFAEDEALVRLMMEMRGLAIMLLALGFGMAPDVVTAVAQHHAAKQKAQKPKTDTELIASAMSAAPWAVSKDATIIAVGSDGKLRTLRQGRGAFTCVPDDPNTPGNDPMCLDRNGFEWLKALLAHEMPPEGKIRFAYMLKGGSDASNDDPFCKRAGNWQKVGANGTTRDDRRARHHEDAG